MAILFIVSQKHALTEDEIIAAIETRC